MPETPQNMSDRPEAQDEQFDVAGDVFGAVRLEAHVFGRFELGAPWAIRFPGSARDFLTFYVMERGGAWLEMEEGGPGVSRDPVALSAGDVVLLPHHRMMVLRDPGRSSREVYNVGAGDCPRPTQPTPFRFGGDGPVTEFVTGGFRFGVATPNALLDSLPPVVHLAAGTVRGNPQLAAAAQLILAESAAPGLGSSMVSARLAEILLIHTLRAWAAKAHGPDNPGLCALADPAIGTALRLIHARPAEDWTVDRLAQEVAMSRSAFAARFTQRVGQAPLQYLTQWRMTQAALRLREGEQSVATIAEQVGYGNAIAFMKAFTRVHGVGPGTYRRNAQGRPAATVG